MCNSLTDLEESHVIPKLVYRWIKKTSPTGRFIRPHQPRRRFQDGVTHKLLCRDCEKNLNYFETFFANKIFHLSRRSSFALSYGNWLLIFLKGLLLKASYDHFMSEDASEYIRKISFEIFHLVKDELINSVGGLEFYLFGWEIEDSRDRGTDITIMTNVSEKLFYIRMTNLLIIIPINTTLGRYDKWLVGDNGILKSLPFANMPVEIREMVSDRRLDLHKYSMSIYNSGL